jgi:phage-related protein
MSGASEATLQDLLAVNKDMAAAIKNLAAKSNGQQGGGAGGGGSAPDPKGPGIFSKALGLAGDTLSGAFTGAMGIASSAFTQISATGKAVWQGQQQLAQTAIDGSGKLSSFADAMSNLPGILGMIAKAASYGAKQQEANLKLFQDVSQSGALFGGSLTNTKAAAMSLGMSFGEFSDYMKENVAAFHKLGGTAQDGADRMNKFNKGFLNGETGRSVMNLGYNTKEAANLLGNYAEVMGGVSQDQMKDQKGMEASVKSFAEELTLSAALEGISRQEKEKQMKEQAANAARELMLSKMTAEEKDRYIKAENRAGLIGGKAAKDALLSATLGLPPMTKEAQIFAATQGKANKEVMNLGEIAKDGSLSEAERQKRMDATTAAGQKAVADSSAKYGKTAVALSFQTGALADSMKGSMKAQADANNKGLKSEEDYQKNIEKAREEVQAAAKKGDAGATQQAANRAKYQGGLMEKLNAALARLFPIVVKVVEVFTDMFMWAVDMGTKILDQVLIPGFKEIFAGISMDDIIKPFKDFWKGLTGGFTSKDIDFKAIKDTIVGFFRPMVVTFGELMNSINFEEVGKTIRAAFISVKDFISGIWNSFSSGGGLESAKDTFKEWVGYIKQFVGLIWKALSSIDWKGIGEGLGSVLGKLFKAVKEIFQPIMKRAGEIFAQIGDDIGPVMSDLSDIVKLIFARIGDIIDLLMKYVWPIVKPIVDGIMNAMIPVWNVVKDIIKIFKAVLAGDFKSIPGLIMDGFKNIIDGVKEFLKGIKEAALKLVSPSTWFGGGDDKKTEPPKQNPAVTAAASSASQATKTAEQYARDVFDKKMDIAKVPADMQAKVNEILKNPPAAWKQAVNQTQQANNQQKPPDTTKKTEEVKKSDPKKDTQPPPTDLNNKDALGILKTIADYQYKTITAVKDLNGNLLKR